MKSNKIFYIKDLVFNLPDDFDGNVTDALQLVVDYRKKSETVKNRKISPTDGNNSMDLLWEDDNNQLVFYTGIAFFENGKWIYKLENERMV